MIKLPTVATLMSRAEFDGFSSSRSQANWTTATDTMVANHGGYPANFLALVIHSGLAAAVAHRWAPINDPTGAPTTDNEMARIDACAGESDLLGCLRAMACARNGSAPSDMASADVTGRMVASVVAYARPVA